MLALQDEVPVLGIKDWPCDPAHKFNVGVRDHHLTDEHVGLLAPYLEPWVATHLDNSAWIPDDQQWWYEGKRCFLDKPTKVNGRCTDEGEVRQEEVEKMQTHSRLIAPLKRALHFCHSPFMAANGLISTFTETSLAGHCLNKTLKVLLEVVHNLL